MIEVRQLSADDWRDWRNLRLRALADAPFAFGSQLADWRDAGEDRWRQRFTDIAYNAIAVVDAEPSGMIGCLVRGRSAEIISVWVAPSARGRGVGDTLIAAAVAWAREHAPGHSIVLAVREDNPPAIALYRRCGFVDDGAIEPSHPDEPPERRMVLGG